MEVDECLQEDRPSDGSLSKRWTCVKYLMERSGPMANPDFEPDPSNLELLRENVKILVVGAGGLGCELLKDLALMGFVDIHVIDMDTIDISNLNRQFLFRPKDVGKPKANVAAEFVNRRVPGCKVTPHYKKIQDYDETFYQQFNIVVCGLDSIVARRWINGMLVSLVGYDEDGNLDPSGIIPLIDGGTEGFKGNARVIIPGMSACIECNLDLFPPQVTFPMCTIATIPRLPAHCIEYVRVLQWPQDKPFGVAKGKEIQVEILTQNVQLLYQGAYSNMLTDLHLSFENWDMISKQTLPQEEDVGIDGDDPEHIQWIYNKALERAANFGIQGLSYRLTQGVIKHIIPAVASTNAVIAAICANEVFKLATSCYPIMNNYMVFNDTEGIYTYTFEAERRDDCPACSKKPLDISLPAQAKLQDLIEELKENPRTQMKSPGLTTIVGGKNKTLYMPNIPAIETRTRPNLEKLLKDLGIEDKQEIHVSDVTSPKMAICRVHLNEGK